MAPDPAAGVLVSAPAKINVGLAVVGRRPDGYHDLRTLFQAIEFCDTVALRPRGDGRIRCRVQGNAEVPEDERNLAVRAARLLRETSGAGGLDIEIEKRIPAGAGLGGGSSDAAAVLVGANRLLGLGLEPARLAGLALELGSDVPFFLRGGLARGEGRGERLTPLEARLPGAWVLVIPGFGVSTPVAFGALPDELTSGTAKITLLEESILAGDVDGVVRHLCNDLEDGVVRMEPRLDTVRERLFALGAAAVSLTGSGSGVLAVFRQRAAADAAIRAGGDAFGARLWPVQPRDDGVRLEPQS